MKITRKLINTSAYRSGLEQKIADQIGSVGIKVVYEDPKSKIVYEIPAKDHKYTPDFILPNGIIIESKGLFTAADRQKHLYIKSQHPEKDIRFVFSNSKAKISKKSKTTYADWCIKYGFKYADKLIPTEWLMQPSK